jgi:hypothetical protein
MNFCKNISVAALIAVSSSWACASGVSLTFEGARGALNTFYAGGTDSQGHAGPNVGISFVSANAVVDNKGGNSYGPPLTNVPSPNTVLEHQAGSSIVINSTGGFTGGFSLYFSSSATNNGTVNVYSGANGTGTLLATFSLAGQTQCPSTPLSYYCNWSAVGVSFSGVAKSVTLTASDTLKMFYDNVTFGSDVPLLGSSTSASALLN